MSDFLAIAVTLILATNPLMLAAALRGRLTEVELGKALAVAFLLLAGLATGGATLLDALDIEAETFRIAAGVVLLVSGAVAIVPFIGPKLIPMDPARALTPAVFPVAWPGIATAAACAGAVNFGANDGGFVTVAAAFVAVALAGVVLYGLTGRARLAVLTGARFVGGVLVVAGVDMVISGVQAV